MQTVTAGSSHLPSLRPVFVSGWFCSGTTALFSAYQRLPGHRAYYEPLHDNLLAHIAHTTPKDRHVGVKDYYAAYRNISDIEQHHDRAFAYQHWIMDEQTQCPSLKNWLGFLMQQQAVRHVMKFTRATLRLGWLRAQWPDARIIHLTRNPRDLWVSTRRHLPASEWDNADHPDAYDTFQICVALANQIPILMHYRGSHEGYRRLYILWRLSEQVAAAYADCRVALTDLQAEPYATLESLVAVDAIAEEDVALACSAIARTGHDGWSQYREDAWFAEAEAAADAEFNSLGLDAFPGTPLAALEQAHADAWRDARRAVDWPAIAATQLLHASRQRDETIRLLNEIRCARADS